MNEDTASDCDDDDTLPFLGDPEHKFFSEMTTPSISLIGVAAFKWLIYAFVCDWQNNVFIVVASALSCTPGWAMLKLVVANIQVNKWVRGGWV